MAESIFDVKALFVAMDSKRRSERLTWRDVAKSAGITPSTFSRMALDNSPNVDGLCRMLLWLGDTDVSHFLRAAVADG